MSYLFNLAQFQDTLIRGYASSPSTWSFLEPVIPLPQREDQSKKSSSSSLSLRLKMILLEDFSSLDKFCKMSTTSCSLSFLEIAFIDTNFIIYCSTASALSGLTIRTLLNLSRALLSKIVDKLALCSVWAFDDCNSANLACLMAFNSESSMASEEEKIK